MAKYAGLSRRRFIAGAFGATGIGLLAACGPNAAGQIQSAPYATNAARNGGTGSTSQSASLGGTSPTATMNHSTTSTTPVATTAASSSTTASATKAPAKDWKLMNTMHEQGVKTFLAQPKTIRGGQPMPFTLQDGIKVFDVTAKAIQWELSPGQMVEAWTYNGTVPAPEIRVTQGDKVRIRLKNELDEPTAIHFHGLLIPNPMDGVPFVTQPPVNPGEMFIYDFIARNPGSHMYHAHLNSATQVTKGLLGAFIIEPKDTSGYPQFDKEYTMILGDGPLGFTLNGKSFPGTEVVTAKKGEKLLVRFMNEGLMIHPMHLHGMAMTIVAQDGYVNTPYKCDTVNVAPGQRIDAIIDCTEAGAWAFHCHILTHAEGEMGMFGMVTALVIT